MSSRSLLANHIPDTAACDFFTVPTVTSEQVPKQDSKDKLTAHHWHLYSTVVLQVGQKFDKAGQAR